MTIAATSAKSMQTLPFIAQQQAMEKPPLCRLIADKHLILYTLYAIGVRCSRSQAGWNKVIGRTLHGDHGRRGSEAQAAARRHG